MTNEKLIDTIKKKYLANSRVRLIHMDDTQAPPVNTMGTVTFVDDMGTVHVRWDTGSSLGAVLGDSSSNDIITIED